MPTLIVSPEAEQDLLDIWLYIAEDSSVNADRFSLIGWRESPETHRVYGNWYRQAGAGSRPKKLPG